MTNLIHCDGPDCSQTRDPSAGRRLCDAPWLAVASDGMHEKHFHSKRCLGAWVSAPAFAPGGFIPRTSRD